jgi:hypothetical protein
MERPGTSIDGILNAYRFHLIIMECYDRIVQIAHPVMGSGFIREIDGSLSLLS